MQSWMLNSCGETEGSEDQSSSQPPSEPASTPGEDGLVDHRQKYFGRARKLQPLGLIVTLSFSPTNTVPIEPLPSAWDWLVSPDGTPSDLRALPGWLIQLWYQSFSHYSHR